MQAQRTGKPTAFILKTNGLIVQWGRLQSDFTNGWWITTNKALVFPIPFSTTNYSITLQGEGVQPNADVYVVEGFLVHSRKQTGCDISHFTAGAWDDVVLWCNWFAIGI